MSKRGQGFPHNWKVRFFSLDNCMLKYYESAHALLPKGSVKISSVHIIDSSKYKGAKKGDATFTVKGSRDILCSCQNEAKRAKWIEAISTNLRVQKRLDRLQMIYEAVSPEGGTVNIYQLSVVAKLSYCPSVSEKKQILTELENNYPTGKMKLKNAMDLVRKINPPSPQQMDEGWKSAIQKYCRTLSGRGILSTFSKNDAELLLYALVLPPKSVLERFRKFFREKDGGKLTYYTMICGLQQSDNGNLCLQFNLNCDVPSCSLESKGLYRMSVSMALGVPSKQKRRSRLSISKGSKELTQKRSPEKKKEQGRRI